MIAREVREKAAREARRVFDALSPGERSDLQDEMVLGVTVEARAIVADRFYDGREVPRGVMGALSLLIADWEVSDA